MKRALLIFGLVVGGLLMLGPLWGKLIAVISMRQAFGVASPHDFSSGQELSVAIDQTMTSTGVGFIACPIGLALLILCLIQLPISGKVSRTSPPPLPPTNSSS